MKKFLSIFIIIICANFVFAQTASSETEEIDQDILDFIDELNSQDYQAELQAMNDVILKFSEINPENQVVDFNSYLEKMTPTNTEEFYNLSLSEKMKVYRENSKIEAEMTNAFISVMPSQKNSSDYIKQKELITELINHSTKLISITQMIAESSNEYVKVAIGDLTQVQTYLEDANTKIDLLNAQIDLINESLAYSEQKDKRAFIAGNIMIPIVGVIGLVPCITLMAKGQDIGYNMMWADISAILGCELIWNSGHLIFKMW